ncbi:MAG TPA: oxygenase MpaB family protein [Myxococcota bacterium]
MTTTTRAHALPTPAAGPLERLRRQLVAQIEEAVGRHAEPAIYDGEPGDPGLCGGPGSMSWELHGDLATLVIAGTGAILMELLHPSVMAGVAAHSSYRTDPVRRARNTLGYVLRTTFGSTPAATRVIESVKQVHARVEGVRPDGVPYRALDPELIAWVHTAIPWAVMHAYERYRRPLTLEEKNRYLREQARIGRMGGADRVPETVAEVEAWFEAMRPVLAFTEQTRAFLDFVAGRDPEIPAAGWLDRFDRWTSIRASMELVPEWAQRLTGTHAPAPLRWLWLRPHARLRARLVRWAVPELPCKRMAMARACA